MRTQWRVGPNGAYGLDYDTALNLMPRLGISRDNELQVLDDLRVMEAGALEEIRRKQRQ